MVSNVNSITADEYQALKQKAQQTKLTDREYDKLQWYGRNVLGYKGRINERQTYISFQRGGDIIFDRSNAFPSGEFGTQEDGTRVVQVETSPGVYKKFETDNKKREYHIYPERFA